MNNVEKKSDDKELINSKKNIPNQKKLNKSFLTQKNLNKQNESKTFEKLTDNEKIILNTNVNITVELGKSKIKIKDFLGFSKGSMLILDKLVKEPLDIFVNGHLIASGEIVVLEKKYGLRITNIKNSLKTVNVSV